MNTDKQVQTANIFTVEEIAAAKRTRERVNKENIDKDRAIYMAGEICMWDELQTSLPELKEGDWIRVDSGKLPDWGEFVLVYNTEGATMTGRILGKKWCACFLDGETLVGELEVTHWRYLPSPPKTNT
jgi:hypothetical protein